MAIFHFINWIVAAETIQYMRQLFKLCKFTKKQENNSFLPWIVAALQLSKKNSFRGNYSRKYGSFFYGQLNYWSGLFLEWLSQILQQNCDALRVIYSKYCKRYAYALFCFTFWGQNSQFSRFYVNQHSYVNPTNYRNFILYLSCPWKHKKHLQN